MRIDKKTEDYKEWSIYNDLNIYGKFIDYLLVSYLRCKW